MKNSSVYGLLILLAVLAVYYLVRAVKRVRYTGRTLGVVTGVEYPRGIHSHGYYIRFRYTVDGEAYEGRTSISGLQLKRFEPGKTRIPVQYKLRRPEKYVVPDPYYL